MRYAERVLPALYHTRNGLDGGRRDLAVMGLRIIRNAQTQVFHMARPSSRALVLRW
jgi:hypothetical protein